MAVKKRVNNSIDNFIDKGAEVKSSKDRNFKNILVRIPTCVLSELDYWVQKKPWVNRTQWIVEAIHDKIKSDFCDEKENARTGN